MTWISVIAALAVHAVILGTVSALGVSLRHGVTGAATRPAAPADDPELGASCFDNVVFATSGRAALCLAPWIRDVDECLRDAQMSLWIDLSGCQARNDPGTAITMIEPRAAERLRPIDPEKLLDDARREIEPPKPKPLAAPAPPPAQPPPPPPPAQKQLPQQIVETVKPSEEKEPDNARFLAEYNTRVDKQTVARGARSEPMVAKSKPEELTPKEQPRPEPAVAKHDPDRPIGQNESAPDTPGKLSMRHPGPLFPAQTEQETKSRGVLAGTTGALAADGYAARRGDGAIEQERRERSEQARGQDGAGGGVPKLPNLRPSEEVLERALGGGSVDHLEDVDNGDETSLSAKRWIYASFFNRLKRQVAQNWDPNSVWRRVDPTGTVYGNKTRITEVRVSLSRTGELAKVVVTSPSGSGDLDEEALRAFRAASPFPNPPEGLLQKDDLITFGFAFYFTMGTPHLSWRLPQAM